MDLYQHFRKEEHAFIDQVLSWIEQVERSYQIKITNFLDPREQQIVNMLIGSSNSDLHYKQFGGGTYTERKRAVIAPFYEEIVEDTFQITLVEATYPEKFVTLSHRDVLGAFLSLGMERGKLGDIFIEDGLIQILIAREISPFVLVNLLSIKNAKVNFIEKPLSYLVEKAPNWVQSNHTVSSLRLDAVLKEIYNISRKDAVEYIQKKFVKVNYKVVDEAKYLLQEGDMISLRGKGRSMLIQISGYTKKDKIKITTAILK